MFSSISNCVLFFSLLSFVTLTVLKLFSRTPLRSGFPNVSSWMYLECTFFFFFGQEYHRIDIYSSHWVISEDTQCWWLCNFLYLSWFTYFHKGRINFVPWGSSNRVMYLPRAKWWQGLWGSVSNSLGKRAMIGQYCQHCLRPSHQKSGTSIMKVVSWLEFNQSYRKSEGWAGQERISIILILDWMEPKAERPVLGWWEVGRKQWQIHALNKEGTPMVGGRCFQISLPCHPRLFSRGEFYQQE